MTVDNLPRLLPVARAALARALVPVWESGLAVGLSGLAGVGRGDFDEVAERSADAVRDMPTEAARVLRRLELDHGLILLPLDLLRALLRVADVAAEGAPSPAVERLAVAVRSAVLEALASVYAEALLGAFDDGRSR